MIDLHLHLDGSLPLPLVQSLITEQHLDLPTAPEQLRPLLTVPATCRSLNDYLACFSLPTQLLQSAEALTRAAQSLAEELAQEGHWYAEIRFAPQLHTQQGLTQSQAVEAVLAGLQAAHRSHPGFFAQAILCCMRGGEETAQLETVHVAEHTCGHGVCALDLAGAEALYPTSAYRTLFERARALQLPFTIHAGEADGAESILTALEFGASRIGHGVRSIESEPLLQRFAQQQIPLELCFTSNLQTKAVPSAAAFPLRDFLRRNICATLNTDNRTVSGVTLSEEFSALHITRKERTRLLKNSIHAAFLSPEQKRQLLAKLSA